ncbi:mannose-1-phosphate guanylyltransferase [Dethiosulfatibacter aminovorans DSM 17477]|uniref:mannose-1-phosphate guanylyltransferase n=1 Tax=Dethiosulfatibacter aminovorans DSM 17477 TaxID=1121476 RepID=A0A1M6HAK3_9FIRM|nr:mannose-1-phosphate guanylyltransferase [Dethiosulfatibacter aminovorans]SHJ19261.1 mannose-1-phosphate guanylyltransferase [Dethiosulfatibacter aminovorans DSM 17477]
MITTYIMAGGSGSRFWPLSTKKRPKQLLNLASEKSMIRETVDRVLPIIRPENIYVGTNILQVDEMRKELQDIPAENIIVEPEFKDTAAAIGYGALIIENNHGNIPMIVLPADHIIKDEIGFRHILLKAVEESKRGNIITLGIKPSKPDTGYGYIETNSTISVDLFKSTSIDVVKFWEKPDITKATEYINSGKFLWNSGMFVFTTNMILSEFEKYLPEHYKILMEIKSILKNDNVNLKSHFDKFEKVSIDYGVMEKSDKLKTIPVDFGWNNIGNFTALEDIFEKNQNGSINKAGKLIEIDSKNNIVISNQTVALVGIENAVVVEKDGNILICSKDCVQNIKNVPDKL